MSPARDCHDPTDDSQAQALEVDSIIVIRPEDINFAADRVDERPIVIGPEDNATASRRGAGGMIIIRPEDLPCVPYRRSVSPKLIRITPPLGGLCALERRMLDLINADRAAHRQESGGAGPLEWDQALAAVARAHSEDMTALGYMGHVNRAGLAPQDRLQRAGIRFMACAENIAGTPTIYVQTGERGGRVMYTGYPSIEGAEEGLMDSPGHRKNILNVLFSHAAVGIARNSDGTLVITQNFIARSLGIG